MVPVRKVSNHGGNIIGKFPSLKMGRMIAFESLIERDFIYLLDYEKEVDCFEEQPLKIEYVYDGKQLHYTPDFHIIEKGRNILVECKAEKFVKNEENQRKADAASKWCVARDWEYRIITEQQIRNGFRLQNIKLLTRYARQPIAPSLKASIYGMISNPKFQATIGNVSKELASVNACWVQSAIFKMAFCHEIYLPLNKDVISWRTPIFLAFQEERGL